MEINDLLKIAVERGASDIHLTVGLPPLLRQDGLLLQLDQMERLSPEDTKRFAYSIMDEKHIEHYEKHGGIDFSYAISGFFRFRINVYSQRGSVCIAMRAVPLTVPTIEGLGLPAVLKDISGLKKGLVLVTGPTGSGKSTTLAAMINEINDNRVAHILTLEDPIEYLHQHNKSMVNQRELGLDMVRYSDALRDALHQDPDVILVGEMSDIETISTAITAAETGHLVLSTLHTMGAVPTIDRLIELYPLERQQQVRMQLSTVLQVVISQQLIGRSDNSGRVAAMEVMVCNPAVRNHMREGKTQQITNSIQTNRKDGMISMDAAIADLYKSGVISLEDAESHAIDRGLLAKLI